ncbi:adenylate kinase isoenzyme 6-like [Plasmopara halstedii]|uniref:Adenylate kinase isoenzyme 6 homolog n=1 Tax=Plasmopara halstedii TaxID=4781 RepID=A0A0P1B162_PLAHL|nr:adenylate kinase isoenzyme 6-like [Plasmopara halstedii]CEG47276.1 adenylate kinase isoenzyme 6-like [Plasmopara halstedii]|eukprot:XP_024583645.1 adenylate kinase isoenzyme 6-like [Plasmopara halstedii]
MTRSPNILVTGTPGTGKTSMCQQLAERSQFLTHVNVGELIKEKGLHNGRDEDFDCFVLDEDKVCDEMEDMMTEGGKVVDFHTCDFFPERWFDLVVVLRVDNTTLYDRLQKRGYSEKKVAENVECEIMEVVLQDARESYAPEIVQELLSRTVEDMESNIERILMWVQHWMNQHTDD